MTDCFYTDDCDCDCCLTARFAVSLPFVRCECGGVETGPRPSPSGYSTGDAIEDEMRVRNLIFFAVNAPASELAKIGS